MKKTLELQPLNIDDSKRLAQLEGVLKKGMDTFMEVGEALLEISKKRLYRETHLTFSDYMAEKWGKTRQWAHNLIGAAELVKSLPADLSTRVDTEKKARALKSVPKKQRNRVIEVAAQIAEEEKKPLTAKTIETAAASVTGAIPKPTGLPNYGAKAANVNFYTSGPAKPHAEPATGETPLANNVPVENLWAMFVPWDEVAKPAIRAAETAEELAEVGKKLLVKHGKGRIIKLRISGAILEFVQ